MSSKHTLPITLSGTGNELDRCSEQTGGPSTLTLEVSGEPARLQYRYQQTKLSIASGNFDPKNWSPQIEVNGGLFTIGGLVPTAMAGSLYVQVREFAKTHWRNWSEVARIKKWDGSQVGASAGDADNDKEAPAESKKRPVVVDDDNDSDDDGQAPAGGEGNPIEVGFSQDAMDTDDPQSAPAPAPAPAPEPAPALAPAPAPAPGPAPAPAPASSSATELSDKDKQEILTEFKRVQDDCRRDDTIAENHELGHRYIITFKPKSEAKGQKQDYMNLRGPGLAARASEADLKRVLGLASDTAGSKRKLEPQWHRYIITFKPKSEAKGQKQDYMNLRGPGLAARASEADLKRVLGLASDTAGSKRKLEPQSGSSSASDAVASSPAPAAKPEPAAPPPLAKPLSASAQGSSSSQLSPSPQHVFWRESGQQPPPGWRRENYVTTGGCERSRPALHGLQ